jgi:hypothetical protein
MVHSRIVLGLMGLAVVMEAIHMMVLHMFPLMAPISMVMELPDTTRHTDMSMLQMFHIKLALLDMSIKMDQLPYLLVRPMGMQRGEDQKLNQELIGSIA